MLSFKAFGTKAMINDLQFSHKNAVVLHSVKSFRKWPTEMGCSECKKHENKTQYLNKCDGQNGNLEQMHTLMSDINSYAIDNSLREILVIFSLQKYKDYGLQNKCT